MFVWQKYPFVNPLGQVEPPYVNWFTFLPMLVYGKKSRLYVADRVWAGPTKSCIQTAQLVTGEPEIKMLYTIMSNLIIAR